MTKQQIIKEVGLLPGIDEPIITKKAALEAIVNLNCFETKQQAKDVINELAKLGLFKSNITAAKAVDGVLDTNKSAVIVGEAVYLPGFCNFKPAIAAAKPAKEGRNPQTGEPITISAKPAKKVVRIKPTAPFAKAIANS